jgi:hypothetical protein
VAAESGCSRESSNRTGAKSCNLTFSYEANSVHFQVLAPGLTRWLTTDVHPGFERSYFAVHIGSDTYLRCVRDESVQPWACAEIPLLGWKRYVPAGSIQVGIAESLLYEFPADVRRLLASTGSPREFARDVRRAVWRAHLRFVGALAAMTGILGSIAVAAFGMTDPRFVLLGLDYLVLGAAVFAAMVLTLIARIAIVFATLGTGAAVLIVFSIQSDYLVDDAAALARHGAVGLALLAVHAILAMSPRASASARSARPGT